MTRALGGNALLHMEKEATYGTPPGGNWKRLPFISTDLGERQGLIDANVLGVSSNRDAGAPFLDVVTVNGRIEVPVELGSLGHWLRLLFGAPTTTGTSPNYTHVFHSGGALPSNSIEIGHPDMSPAVWRTYVGVRADTLDVDFSPSGAATATIGLIAQGASQAATSGAGTPTTDAYLAVSKAQGSISRNGSPLGQITAGRLTYSNGVEAVRTIRADRKIEGADAGISTVTGQITARFANTTLYADAKNGVPCELAFAYVINANRSVEFLIYEAYLSVAEPEISGPQGLQATLEFRGAYNQTAQRMMRVTLKNAVASYA